MRARLWTLAAVFGLGGIAMPATAQVNWSGAGWYIAINLDYGDGQGPQDYLNYGPYSSEADCKSAWSNLSRGEQHVSGSCAYFAQDPDKN